MPKITRQSLPAVLLLLILAPASAQTTDTAIIFPQLGAFSRIAGPKPQVTSVEAGVVIREQSAVTTLDIALHNPSNRRAEAEVWIPIPPGAVIRSFMFNGTAAEAAAKILTKGEAAALYHQITAQLKDPAILEFAGYGMARSRVFPIEPNQNQRVRLTYENILPVSGGRIDYFLPRSESLAIRIPWKVSVKMTALRPISTAYSPSHKIEMRRESAETLSVRTTPESEREAGPFQVSFLTEQQGVTSTLYAAPDDRAAGGYFLLLAGPPAELSAQKAAARLRREVTLVLDRSGSMLGDKINQLRQSARQTLSSLGENEYFNLVVYNDVVQVYSPKPLQRTTANLRAALAFIDSIKAEGGTNIHDALTEALRLPTVEGTLPVVLFVTDGQPTVGNTSEVAIRNVATAQNIHSRRVFSFGVGTDVNAPLLDKVSSENRGVSSYVLPGDTPEKTIAETVSRLSGPILSDTKLEVLTSDGRPDPGRVIDVLPARLPDLYDSDQFVILGRFNEDKPMTVRISGNFLGKPTSFTQQFQMDRKTTNNAFVGRLWASRKIGLLVDELRQMGAAQVLTVATQTPARNAAHTTALPAPSPKSQDAIVSELTGEIIRISTQFGIMTQYTAFLALEGYDLSKRDATMARATQAFRDVAMNGRTGQGAVTQSLNNNVQMAQVQLNRGNQFITADLKQTEIRTIQLANDITFFKKGGTWIDSRLIAEGAQPDPVRTIAFGSREFETFSAEMATQGRAGFATLTGEALVLYRGQPVLVKLQ